MDGARGSSSGSPLGTVPLAVQKKKKGCVAVEGEERDGGVLTSSPRRLTNLCLMMGAPGPRTKSLQLRLQQRAFNRGRSLKRLHHTFLVLFFLGGGGRGVGKTFHMPPTPLLTPTVINSSTPDITIVPNLEITVVKEDRRSGGGGGVLGRREK